MKIYVGHSTSFNYHDELYLPLRKSALNAEHEIILPHEKSDAQFSSKELFQAGCDLMVAEVSWPSTGLGIELGWANALHIPIVFLYKTGSTVSGALKSLSQDFLEYSHATEIPALLEAYLKNKPAHNC